MNNVICLTNDSMKKGHDKTLHKWRATFSRSTFKILKKFGDLVFEKLRNKKFLIKMIS